MGRETCGIPAVVVAEGLGQALRIRQWLAILSSRESAYKHSVTATKPAVHSTASPRKHLISPRPQP